MQWHQVDFVMHHFTSVTGTSTSELTLGARGFLSAPVFSLWRMLTM